MHMKRCTYDVIVKFIIRSTHTRQKKGYPILPTVTLVKMFKYRPTLEVKNFSRVVKEKYRDNHYERSKFGRHGTTNTDIE